MDKNEYKIKTEEMLELMDEGDYAEAAQIADLIDWRKVRSGSMLVRVSRIYERDRQYDKSYRILRIANDRSDGSRKIVYQLCLLALKTGNVDQAIDYYDEFAQIAPKDPNRHILHYMILKAQRGPIEQQIEALEEFKKNEYIEEWGYELAKLYQAAGMTAECLDECDELILWFSEGQYVYKAMELKMQYKPLTPSQQEKYDRRYERGQEADREEYGVLPPEEDRSKAQDSEVKEAKAGGAQAADILYDEAEDGTETIPVDAVIEEADDEANTVEMEPITDAALEAISAAVKKTTRHDLETAPIRLPDEEELHADPHIQAEEAKEQAEAAEQENDAPVEEPVFANGILSREMRLEDALRSLLSGQGERTGQADKEQADPEAGLEKQIEQIEELEDQWPAKTADGADGERAGAASKAGEAAPDTVGSSHESEEQSPQEDPDGPRQEQALMKSHHVSGDDKTLPVNGEVTELKLDEYSVDEYIRLQSQSYSVRPDLPKQESTGQIPVLPGMEEEANEPMEGQFSFDDIFDNWENGRPSDAPTDKAERTRPDRQTAADRADADAKTMPVSAVPPDIQRMIDEIEGLVPGDVIEATRRDAKNKEKEIDAMRIDEPIGQEEDLEEELQEAENFREVELDEGEELDEDEALDEGEELDEDEEFGEGEELDEDEEFGEGEELDEDEEFGEGEELDADEEFVEGEELDEDEAFGEELDEGEELADTVEPDEDDELGNWFEDEEPEIVSENFDIFDEFKPVSEEEMAEDDREIPDEEEGLIDVMSATTPLSRKETAKLRATGKTAPLPLGEISGALSRSNTGFVVQGRYDLEANSGIGTVAGLTEEQKKIFSYFVPVRGMSEQLVDVLEQDKNCTNRQGTSATGNLLIIGDKGNGKTVLAVDMVKALHKQRGTGSGKVAIVTGESLNKKRIGDIFERLYGGALIIEKAGKMNEKTVMRLNHAMEQKTGELLVVLEEQRKPLDRLLTSNREFRRKFTSRLEVPIFIDDELVTFGQAYAKENGYFIDEMGILALYSRIDELQREDHFVTVAEIKEIMDRAIAHAGKGAAKKLVKRVFRKNPDAYDRTPLTEKDFR